MNILSPVKSSRYIAVELEIAGARARESSEIPFIHEVVSHWGGQIVSDGSLPPTGFEINTAPAVGLAFAQQMKDLTDALANQKAWVNTQCGMHTHIDSSDLGYDGLRNVLILYSHVEQALFSLLPPSRRDNSYCRRLPREVTTILTKPRHEFKERINDYLYENKTNIRHGKREKGNARRYLAFNIHSWHYRGTIEFRMHHGTTNFKKIIGWTSLLARMMDKANSKDFQNLLTMEPLQALFAIAPDLNQYLRDRLASTGAEAPQTPTGNSTPIRSISIRNIERYINSMSITMRPEMQGSLRNLVTGAQP